MKKVFLFILFSFALFQSCQKESSSSEPSFADDSKSLESRTGCLCTDYTVTVTKIGNTNPGCCLQRFVITASSDLCGSQRLQLKIKRNSDGLVTTYHFGALGEVLSDVYTIDHYMCGSASYSFWLNGIQCGITQTIKC